MEIIRKNDMIIYRASKGKKVMFINDRKGNTYSEIEVKEETDKIVEVEQYARQ